MISFLTIRSSYRNNENKEKYKTVKVVNKNHFSSLSYRFFSFTLHPKWKFSTSLNKITLFSLNSYYYRYLWAAYMEWDTTDSHSLTELVKTLWEGTRYNQIVNFTFTNYLCTKHSTVSFRIFVSFIFRFFFTVFPSK